MLIDTHCHVNFSAYKNDADDVIQRSLSREISLVVVGSQIDTSRRAVEYAEKYDHGVYAAVGLHPVHLIDQEIDEEEITFRTRAEKFDYEVYKELAQSEKVVAIGEMGLDYYRIEDKRGSSRVHESQKNENQIKEMQKETFEQGLRLASELGKPIIIHTRPSPNTFDAYDDVLALLQIPNSKFQIPNGVVHCFGGILDQARKFVDLGFYIGITGIVTFKNASVLQNIVREISLDHLLIETDSPYLSPEPHRGTRNEPSYVEYVARKVAELKGIEYDNVARATTENAKKLFGV